jgi:hypothetical protein
MICKDFKGNRYHVVITKNEKVLIKNLKNNQYYWLTLNHFYGNIHIDGKEVPRFTKIIG